MASQAGIRALGSRGISSDRGDPCLRGSVRKPDHSLDGSHHGNRPGTGEGPEDGGTFSRHRCSAEADVQNPYDQHRGHRGSPGAEYHGTPEVAHPMRRGPVPLPVRPHEVSEIQCLHGVEAEAVVQHSRDSARKLGYSHGGSRHGSRFGIRHEPEDDGTLFSARYSVDSGY